jgi:hypothetical protein
MQQLSRPVRPKRGRRRGRRKGKALRGISIRRKSGFGGSRRVYETRDCLEFTLLLANLDARQFFRSHQIALGTDN